MDEFGGPIDGWRAEGPAVNIEEAIAKLPKPPPTYELRGTRLISFDRIVQLDKPIWPAIGSRAVDFGFPPTLGCDEVFILNDGGYAWIVALYHAPA